LKSNTNRVTVRGLRPDDAQAVAKFATRLVEQHIAYDSARFARIATLEGMAAFYGGQTDVDNAVVLVAEIDGAVVGFAYLTYHDKSYMDLAVTVASLHDIYVDETARHTGAGRAMMDASFEWARNKGASKLTLHVAVKNTVATEFFQNSGFRPTMTEMTLNLT
jgi:GNAT superfamily N-acetyltransferase